MKINIRLKVLLFLLFVSNFSYAQDEPNLKFGKVTNKDFDINSPVIDSNTNAIVLIDVGNSKIEGNNKGWFSLIYKRTKRIKVFNKKGFDAGNISIGLYTSSEDNREEKLTDCKAITYNIENGVVQQTKLEATNIFKEKLSKNGTLRKFTFPSLKEGSILEYTYTIESDFLFNLRPWEFQDEYPRIFSQYTVAIPEFFNYVFLSQGYIPLKNIKKDVFKTYSVSESNSTQATERYSLTGYETQNTWTARDVPGIKEEPFTSTIENHNSKIEFQLSQYRFPNSPIKDIIGSWASASEQLLKEEDFGGEITRPNIWLANDVKDITREVENKPEKARAIYNYVRDHFTLTGYGIYISDNTTLKDVFRKKSGNIAEINLLLIAMLKQADINAEPVLISTRSNGWAHPYYPLLSKYNYVLCRTILDGKTYYLDASQPRWGFGKLTPDCYNGPGFVVSQTPKNIMLESDSIRDAKTTMIFLVKKEKGAGLVGSFSATPGYYESEQIRNILVKKDVDEYFKDIEKGYAMPMKFSGTRIDSLKKYDFPISVKYDMDMNLDDEDIIYFNPLFSEATKNNPFTSAERKYPVEMPFTSYELYILNMEIPRGYTIEELPKSTRVKLNDNEGTFEYIVSATDSKIMLQSKIDLKKANFTAEDYQSLRDFFGHIAKKHSEQIVLKKIK